MGNVDILKRAWAMTWKYKVLWLFGLFAGAGGSSSGSYNNSGSGGSSGSNAVGDKLASQIEQYYPILIALAVLLILIGIVFFVLTFAAQAGLVHLANEAEEKREVRGGDGWRVGFKYWGRTFAIDFLIGLPIILVVIVFAIIFGASIVGIIAGAAGLDNGSSAASAGLISGIGGMCCALLVLIVASFAYAIVFGTTAQLALRYAVLEDRGAIASLKAGWADVWAKRGAVGMFFTVWVVNILYGLAVGLALMIFIIPMVLMVVAGNLPGAIGVGLVAGLVSMLPAAIYGAFVSCAWTLFFRRMNGRDQVAAPVYAGGYPPPAPGATGFPPAPPAAGFAPPMASDYAAEAPAPAVDPWVAANGLPEPPPEPVPAEAAASEVAPTADPWSPAADIAPPPDATPPEA